MWNMCFMLDIDKKIKEGNKISTSGKCTGKFEEPIWFEVGACEFIIRSVALEGFNMTAEFYDLRPFTHYCMGVVNSKFYNFYSQSLKQIRQPASHKPLKSFQTFWKYFWLIKNLQVIFSHRLYMFNHTIHQSKTLKYFFLPL